MNCRICLKKIFGDTRAHMKHLKSYHPFEMTYKCIYPKCYRIFSSFFSLQKHLGKCLFHIHQLQDTTDRKSQNDSSLQTSVIFEMKNIPESNSCNTNDFVSEESIASNNIENCVLKFIAQLYQKPISRSIVQKIIEEFKDTIQNVSEHFLQKLKSQFPSDLHNLGNCFKISMLEHIDSEYKRFQYLQNSKYFISPKSFIIGELYTNKRKEQKTAFLLLKNVKVKLYLCVKH